MIERTWDKRGVVESSGVKLIQMFCTCQKKPATSLPLNRSFLISASEVVSVVEVQTCK